MMKNKNQKRHPLDYKIKPNPAKGFTLVEMIMVIVITGIIGGMVAVFMKAPVQEYVDVARRTDMTDIGDTALRRMGRDLHLALPNSVSVTTAGGARNAGGCTGANQCFMEILPTTGGGRYRSALAATVPFGDLLDFTIADTSFDVFGPMPALAAGDQIVVYNLGIAGADAYVGNNRTPYISNTATNISVSAKQFPFASPAGRFQVINTPISYVCDPIGGTLKIYSGYPIQASQPNSIPITGAISAILANHVNNCSFNYNPNIIAARVGLVTMNLSISEGGETVTMYNSTHINNTP